MTTHTFTPGSPTPWRKGGRMVIDARGDAVAAVNFARPENAAHDDARLIAAAPDLYAALQLAEQWLGSYDPHDSGVDAAITAARAALAKVEG